MPFVPTGFPALDQMLDGGFPRGSLTLVSGAPGSGKTQILRKCCERAHKKGIKVVYLTSEEVFRSEYPVREIFTLEDVTRLVANLLHPGKKDKTDLLILDSLTHMASEVVTDGLATRARQLDTLFRCDFDQTAVVVTCQLRREDRFSTPTQTTNRASVVLGISKGSPLYQVNLVKSREGHAGVSCDIRPDDMQDFDRSKILTRYERILRGRN